MRLELYYGETCPFSAMVCEFIAEHDLGDAIECFEIDDDGRAANRLEELTGGKQVPCLVIDGSPMLESKQIIAWLVHNKIERRTG